MKTNVDIAGSKVKLFKMLFLMSSSSIIPLIIYFTVNSFNMFLMTFLIFINIGLSILFLNKIGKYSSDVVYYTNRAKKNNNII